MKTAEEIARNELAVIRHLEKQGCFIDWSNYIVWSCTDSSETDGDVIMIREQTDWGYHP